MGNCHDRGVESSRLGSWVRRCEESDEWVATSWLRDDEEARQVCATYKLPETFHSPYICVGGDSRFSEFRGPSKSADGDV